jgi:hypothetical protein
LGFTAFAAALACSRSSCCQFIVAAPLVDHARAVLTDDATRRISGRLKKNLPTNLPACRLPPAKGERKKRGKKTFFVIPRRTRTHAAVMVLVSISLLLLGAGGPLMGLLVIMLLYCYYSGWKSRKPRGLGASKSKAI